MLDLAAWFPVLLFQLNIDPATVDTRSNTVTADLSGLLSILAGLVVGAVILGIAASLLLRFKNS